MMDLCRDVSAKNKERNFSLWVETKAKKPLSALSLFL